MGNFGWTDRGCGVVADSREIAVEEGQVAEGCWAKSHGWVIGVPLEEVTENSLKANLKSEKKNWSQI